MRFRKTLFAAALSAVSTIAIAQQAPQVRQSTGNSNIDQLGDVFPGKPPVGSSKITGDFLPWRQLNKTTGAVTALPTFLTTASLVGGNDLQIDTVINSLGTFPEKYRMASDTDDGPMIQRALDAMNTGDSTYTGGKLILKPGVYNISSQINACPANNSVGNITIEGGGSFVTFLNYSNEGAGTTSDITDPKKRNRGNGIAIDGCTHVRVRGLMVYQPYRHGVTVGEWSNVQNIEVSDVRVSGSRNGSGFKENFGYLIDFRNLWASGNKFYGFELRGYATSNHWSNTYASNNGWDGYLIENTTYSTFISNAADTNGTASPTGGVTAYAYKLHNVDGLTFTSPGCETNPDGCFSFEASTAIAASLEHANSAGTIASVQSPDIHGVTITSPFTTQNGTRTGQASLIQANSSNGKPIEITLTESHEHDTANNSINASGNVRITKLSGVFAGPLNLNIQDGFTPLVNSPDSPSIVALPLAATIGHSRTAGTPGVPTGTAGSNAQPALTINTNSHKLCHSEGGGTWYDATGASCS